MALAVVVPPTAAVVTAVVYPVINLVEGNLPTPRIQGDAVRVHLMLVFLGVIAGRELGGLLGAVPALAVGRVLVDFFEDRLYVPWGTGTARGVTAAATAGRINRGAASDATGEGQA